MTYDHLFRDPPEPDDAPRDPPEHVRPGTEPRDPLPHEPWTELGYAHRLVAVYGDRLRYVPVWKRWLVWDGKRWAKDSTGQTARDMKQIVRRVMSDALVIDDDAKRRAALNLARRAESAAGVAGALTLAGTEPGIAVTPDQLDADPWLLNTANGVLDLRSGDLSPHDPDLLLTRLTGAGYHPDATGAQFTRFLERILPGKEMRAFLARLLGHALVGNVTEHVLPILTGAGNNGKSTLLSTVLVTLGDYAMAADPAVFVERGFEAHPTGVADLFGQRLVVVHESDRGRHLAEGTVKRLTGGDRVKARFMRQDFFEFDPTHTAVMLTNHPPIVKGTDDGIWRRLRLVPFEVRIPAEEVDLGLGERLRLELDAVLAWLVAGYRDWQENGLAEPEQVLDATAIYRGESDRLGRFLADRCVLGPDFTVMSADLWEAWRSWCETEGVEHDTQTAFGRDLQTRGLNNDRNSRTGRMQWHGVGLSSTDNGPTSGTLKAPEELEGLSRYPPTHARGELRNPSNPSVDGHSKREAAPVDTANGRCVHCEQPTRRYGLGGNPLCGTCRTGAEETA